MDLSKIFWGISVWAMAHVGNGFAQPGYPQDVRESSLYKLFRNPPEGFGEVPFYWWQGDTLTRERLAWQLDQLAGKKVSSLQINYSHTDDGKGYFWGSSCKSQPAQFTDEWWDLFGWFVRESDKRGMTVSVSDYTLGIGQGYALDEVRRLHPDIAASQLVFEELRMADGKVDTPLREGWISVSAFKSSLPDAFVDLSGRVSGGRLRWGVPGQGWKVVAVYSQVDDRSYNPMHPLSGSEYVRCFFQRFEDRLPECKRNLDFFFSDELNFNLHGVVWDVRFADEFLKRKGYDIRPYLPALVMDVGGITPKVRLDYNDVFTSLSEENFFIPVYRWHEKRGLIYGCDHGGRGLQVDEFGDYFRTQRWNQGPGSDQPRLERDVVKAKVASSIAHLYERPRVWLEGFYSSGWDTSSSDVADAIFANYALGYNLLSLHGLYYATPGGMWEWAPPCNHFRMPYWSVMDTLLAAVERLSFLYSQGKHHCDVALLYPVEPKVAGYGDGASDAAFRVARELIGDVRDFDFIDYTSLREARVSKEGLSVAGECYEALVVPPMPVIREASLRKLAEWAEAGGLLVWLGDAPVASEAKGRDSLRLRGIWMKMQESPRFFHLQVEDSVLPVLDEELPRDFQSLKPGKRQIYVNHREVGGQHFYGLYGVERGMPCFFRQKGDVEYWDAWTGRRCKLLAVRPVANGTIVEMPASGSDFQTIVFTPHSKAPESEDGHVVEVQPLSREWQCEIVPVLDNRYGDFHYPTDGGLVRPEVRVFRYGLETGNGQERVAEPRNVVYTYGDEFLCSGPLAEMLPDSVLAAMTACGSSMYALPPDWRPYAFSRRWGVFGDPGHQGYHGLKMRMNPEVIRLGKMGVSATSTFRKQEPGGSCYYLYTTVDAPHDGVYPVLIGSVRPSVCFVGGQKVKGDSLALCRGVNRIVLGYDRPVTTYFFIRNPFAPRCSPEKLALEWYGDSSILPFDPYGKGDCRASYSFLSAPGLKGFSVGIAGRNPEVWVDGKSAEPCLDEYGGMDVDLGRTCGKPVEVRIDMDLPFGVKGGAAFTSELVQRVGRGTILTGDWGKTEGLSCYSGAVKYIQNVQVRPLKPGMRVFLAIDSLSSAVSICVNGRNAGVRVVPEWRFDITPFLEGEDNLVELTVYNTASNHYRTKPTLYNKEEPSGILGKAVLEYEAAACGL
ncbi:glycosyl hydrolase [Paraprevotella clara]|uniref:glycosyl hydrolase n=1 Tax=Paraprevotella clara TaxID=454154 RepID=UPI002676E592|nr:glycosyl hydrolase [Paraprevotella clara]